MHPREKWRDVKIRSFSSPKCRKWTSAKTQKELRNWCFLKLWVFQQACLYLSLGAKNL